MKDAVGALFGIPSVVEKVTRAGDEPWRHASALFAVKSKGVGC
jgi:hypothetical protein